MEPSEPASPTQTEDSQISSEVSIEEFQDCVEEILEEPFSEITADSYERRKCYLKNQLIEVSKNCIHPSDSAVNDDGLKVKGIETEAVVISESDVKTNKMEGELDKYKKRIPIADDLNSSEVSMTIGDIIQKFQDTVEEILEEVKKDEPFSKISTDSYERKKCYLRNQLDDLSQFHSVLADKHLQLIDEVSKNCPSLLHPSDSAVKDDALKVKAAVISESDVKIKNLEEELEECKKWNDEYKYEITRLTELLKSKEEIYTQEAERVIESLKEQNNELKTRLSALEAEYAGMKKKLKLSNSEKNTSGLKVKKLETAMVAKNKEVHELKTRLNALETERDVNDFLFVDTKKQLKASNSNNKKLKDKLEVAEDEILVKDKLYKELKSTFSKGHLKKMPKRN